MGGKGYEYNEKDQEGGGVRQEVENQEDDETNAMIMMMSMSMVMMNVEQAGKRKETSGTTKKTLHFVLCFSVLVLNGISKQQKL